MRQVDACDFCGDAPDGVFEVVPATVPDGPVRLALCADCRATLETVVDPLLAADDAGGAATTGESTPDRSRSGDAGAASEPTDADATASSDDDDDAAGDAPRTPTAMRDSPDETPSSDDSGGEDGEPGDDGGGGITIEQPGGGAPADRPDGYAQVLRLLENRDGGMPRDDLRALATNAYDLTGRTFETAVDAALENGDVEDAASGLRRT
jgi:hypothetical protein